MSQFVLLVLSFLIFGVPGLLFLVFIMAMCGLDKMQNRETPREKRAKRWLKEEVRKYERWRMP